MANSSASFVEHGCKEFLTGYRVQCGILEKDGGMQHFNVLSAVPVYIDSYPAVLAGGNTKKK